MTTPANTPALRRAVRAAALLLAGGAQDFDPLLERVGDAQVVLIGEASHGTQEFYELRARITQRLIEEKGFTAVAIEGDWPDVERVHRYVRGGAEDRDARAALGDFREFPTWMWRNTEMLEFVAWLRRHNAATDDAADVGVYGLDLYSLEASADAVVAYLRTQDPAAATRARRRYACFERYGDDPEDYGLAASFGGAGNCADEAAEPLRELERRLAAAESPDDALFSAHRNARVVVNAERYYRGVHAGDHDGWNLRDTHMMETLQALLRRRDTERPSKVVVWAHNSHVGDARATQLGEAGQLNLGQLARQRLGPAAVLVGFSTYDGTVTAATDWGGAARLERVRPGLPGSYEALFHAVGLPAFQLRMDDPRLDGLDEPRLQRAIGVVYRPGTERASHYFGASLTRQFDWMIHVDTTRALEPLEPGKRWTRAARTPPRVSAP